MDKKNGKAYVGYKCPPISSRFRKGQSGNPKGRPKKSVTENSGDRSTNAFVLKEAERLVVVREGEKIQKISAIEAVHRAQWISAIKGNATSQKHAIDRYDQAERERRQKEAEAKEIWQRYIIFQREMIEDAKRKSKTPPTLLPHPDDIIIDERGVRFVGPLSNEELARLEETVRMRDVLIMQDALECRQHIYKNRKDSSDQTGTALVLALTLNQSVPERYRISDAELAFRLDCYIHMPKRLLLRELHRAWHALGVPSRRGAVFPLLNSIKPMADFFGKRINELCLTQN